MEPLISVIVPVYKVEQYLAKCVDSILNQTYRNLEVILVDDGSPDHCGEICDTYAGKDSRVKVIHQQNGGLSSARNAGMAVATGEYVSFVDSDDILVADGLEHMLTLAEKEQADLVIGDHIRFEDALPSVSEDGIKTSVRSRTEAMEEFFRNGCAAWARLYRREIHDGIKFPAGEINEDEAIVLQLLDRCRRIAYTDRIVYFYRSRIESITTSSFSTRKLIWVKHCRDNLAFIRDHYPDLEYYATGRYQDSIVWLLREICLQKDGYESEWESLRTELVSEFSQLWKYQNFRRRIWMVLFSVLPRSICRAIIVKGSSK